jgi:hypothetical protein
MIAPICVDCNQEMKCSKNARVVHDPQVGGFPETYWVGDEFECPVCHNKVVTNFGEKVAKEALGSLLDTPPVPFVHSAEQRELLKQYE